MFYLGSAQDLIGFGVPTPNSVFGWLLQKVTAVQFYLYDLSPESYSIFLEYRKNKS